MMTGISTASAMWSRRPTASASRKSGRVSGWDETPISPAAFFSVTSASFTPLFSQWTPQMPPFSFSFFSAQYIASSPIIMAG